MFSSRKSCLLPPAFSILNLFLKSYIKTQESFPSAFVSSALEMGSFCSKAIYNPELRKTLLCTTTWFKQHPLKPTKSTFKSQIPFLSKGTRKKKKEGRMLSPRTQGASSQHRHSSACCTLPCGGPGYLAALYGPRQCSRTDSHPPALTAPPGSPGTKEAAVPPPSEEAPARSTCSHPRNQSLLCSQANANRSTAIRAPQIFTSETNFCARPRCQPGEREHGSTSSLRLRWTTSPRHGDRIERSG